MKRIFRVVAVTSAAVAALPAAGRGEAVAAGSGDRVPHHALSVRLDPGGHRLEVRDRLTLIPARRDPGGAHRFVLHAGLSPRLVTPGWRLEKEEGPVTASFVGINATTETVTQNVPLEGWRLIPRRGAGDSAPVEIEYAGAIHHPIETGAEEYQRGFSETPGTIEESGVFLSGTSFWIPTFGDSLVTFELEVTGLRPPWDAVSQGKRVRHETGAEGTRITSWSSPDPTEEVYLVAGPWTEYHESAGAVDLFAFLRTPDPGLAARYLDAGRRYLRMYEGVLPRYPYASFSVVENFWDTGYGMPGFTLLGEKILRFPWILTSSYPHEILHNWWGNSVYVDMEGGNWCEGLTAYMADHMFEEQRGEAVTARRTALQKYADFVRAGKDAPLSSFRARRSAATEAVGYGKSLMLFHMVRRATGDEAFLAALARLAKERRFERATWADVAGAFTAETGRDWAPFFEKWSGSPGAPKIELVDVLSRLDGTKPGSWKVAIRLKQRLPDAPFPVTVPVAVTMEGSEDPLWVEIPMEGREATADVTCPAKPVRLDVDPAFDVMRRLDPLEVPPALSTLFGDEDPVFVLPSGASAEESAAWRALASAWAGKGPPRILVDSDAGGFPPGAVWVLGWNNSLRGEVTAGLGDQGVTEGPSGVVIGSTTFDRSDRSVVLVSRRRDDVRSAIAWVAADRAAAIPGLARKLPHYTRYSYLAFSGDEPENIAKGMWEPTSSPMVRNLRLGPLPPLRLPRRRPLADLPSEFDAASLRRTVEAMASGKMEGRGLGSEGLARATDWVETRLREMQLEPAGNGGFRQSWAWDGGAATGSETLTNLVARLPGTDPNLAAHPVVAMAHIDHLGTSGPGIRGGHEGKVHPGADDNASGVAVLLEIARVMAGAPRGVRPVLFAVTTGEESGLLGSRRLLGTMEGAGLPFACVNLDTVGRLRDGKIHVLNADSAREWRHIFMGVQATTGIPITIVPEPLDASDQVACLERGAPAVQIFTGPNADYHRPTDTAEKIDHAGMAKVAEVAHEAISYLAGRAEPLAINLPAAGRSGAAAGAPAPAAVDPPGSGSSGGATSQGPHAPRRAALGTVPDFSFGGPGVRVQEVLPGSPAEAAGILPGDVILALDGAEVPDMRAYSDLLKARKPGDAVTLEVLRGGGKVALTATLGER